MKIILISVLTNIFIIIPCPHVQVDKLCLHALLRACLKVCMTHNIQVQLSEQLSALIERCQERSLTVNPGTHSTLSIIISWELKTRFKSQGLKHGREICEKEKCSADIIPALTIRNINSSVCTSVVHRSICEVVQSRLLTGGQHPFFIVS